MEDLESSMKEESDSINLLSWIRLFCFFLVFFFPSYVVCSFEKQVAQYSRLLTQSLKMIESKFCYMRWDGLVQLLDLMEAVTKGDSKDAQKVQKYMAPMMAKYKLQQKLFGLFIDGSLSEKITPVTTKEVSMALEILNTCLKLYIVNPHSKGFTLLNRLVVETALPQVQQPALLFIRTLVTENAFCLKSFRKSGGVETLDKWVKEQKGAARGVAAKATLDVLDTAEQLLATLRGLSSK